jgi:hypothetical protein
MPQSAARTVEVDMKTQSSARLVRIGQVSTLTKAVILVQPFEPGSLLLGDLKP